MNASELHLLINHLPVLVPFIGSAMMIAGLWLKSKDLREAGLWLVMIGAIFAIPTYLSGEPAESVLKNYPGTSRLLVKEHQDAACFALIILEIVGAISAAFLVCLRLKKSFLQKTLPWAILIFFSLISFGLIARAAHLGGLIHHEEVRSNDHF